MQKNTITIPIEISIDALDEVITTALEGGSNYWYWINNDDLTKMSNWLEDQIKKGYLTRNNQIHYKWLDALFQGWFGKLAIYDKEEYYNLEIPDDFSKLEPIGYLSMENIIKNLPKVQKEYPRFYSQHFPEYNNGDSTSADTIFQMLTLNEIVYG